jgi:hypothetical protein
MAHLLYCVDGKRVHTAYTPPFKQDVLGSQILNHKEKK